MPQDRKAPRADSNPSIAAKRDKRLWAGGTPSAAALGAKRKEEAGKLPPRRPKSIGILRQILKTDPDNFGVTRRLVEIFAMTRRYDDAFALIERTEARGKHPGKALILKSYVLAAKGEHELALDCIREARRETGKALDGAADLPLVEADILISAMRYADAEAALAAHLEAVPGDRQTLRRLGRVALIRQDWERGVELLEPLLNGGVPLGQDAFMLGATLIEKLGEFDRGFRAYSAGYNADLAADVQVRMFYETASPGWVRTNSILNRDEKAFGRAEVAVLEARIMRSIEKREPLALIRLLDGEGRTFEGSDRSLDGAAYWDGHIEPLPELEMQKFQGLFQAAVKQADILGLPTEAMVRNPYNRAVIHHMDGSIISRIRRGEVMVADQPCHFQLHMAGSFGRLLDGRDFVGVVSGRDVARHLREEFGVGRVDWYSVPPQARHDGLGPVPHYPARFEQILAELTVPYDGAIFVVGAGIVGKVYCAEIKRRGGIALDIGAVADIWAGRLDTRPFLTRHAEALSAATTSTPTGGM